MLPEWVSSQAVEWRFTGMKYYSTRKLARKIWQSILLRCKWKEIVAQILWQLEDHERLTVVWWWLLMWNLSEKITLLKSLIPKSSNLNKVILKLAPTLSSMEILQTDLMDGRPIQVEKVVEFRILLENSQEIKINLYQS